MGIRFLFRLERPFVLYDSEREVIIKIKGNIMSYDANEDPNIIIINLLHDFEP